jgi:hypothetical protein
MGRSIKAVARYRNLALVAHEARAQQAQAA